MAADGGLPDGQRAARNRRIRRYRLGHRGAALLCFGGIYALHGIGLVVDPDALRDTLRVHLLIAPTWAWGAAWITGGALATLASRWPLGRDAWGWAVVAGLAGGWSVGYVGGWIVGVSDAWPRALVWGLATVLAAVCADWPEERITPPKATP